MRTDLVAKLIIFLEINEWVRDNIYVSQNFAFLISKVMNAFKNDNQSDNIDKRYK
jgi:hypothetical protein